MGLFWALVIFLFGTLFFKIGFTDFGFVRIDQNECLDLFSCLTSCFTIIENDRTLEPSFSEDYGLFLFVYRSLWNASFTVINKYILKNLILFVIVSAFAELRMRKSLRVSQLETTCFICKLDRKTLDKSSGFDRHVDHEHNMWSYFTFVSMILAKKGQKSYIENYVFMKVAQSLLN